MPVTPELWKRFVGRLTPRDFLQARDREVSARKYPSRLAATVAFAEWALLGQTADISDDWTTDTLAAALLEYAEKNQGPGVRGQGSGTNQDSP